MDPVTHFLTGACLGRAGLNRRTAYATVAATLAAEAPDIDVVWGWGGPVVGFAHHRGMTHTLVGAPFMALAVTLLVWLWHRWRTRRGTQPGGQPARWGWVYAAALLADGSHLLLDWTNNYGIRPFFPWNPRWYSLDLVFIVEPVLLLVLAGALLLPWVFALVDGEVGARRKPFRGRGLATAALAAMVLLWALRYAEHAKAVAMASEPGALGPQHLLRVAAEPYPADPFHWHVLGETADGYLPGEAWTWGNQVQGPARPEDGVLKAPVTPAVTAAKASYLGQVYESWSSWPITEDLGLLPIPWGGVPPPQEGWHTVRFSDMRFQYWLMARGGGENLPLAAWAYVDGYAHVELEAMNGKVQGGR